MIVSSLMKKFPPLLPILCAFVVRCVCYCRLLFFSCCSCPARGATRLNRTPSAQHRLWLGYLPVTGHIGTVRYFGEQKVRGHLAVFRDALLVNLLLLLFLGGVGAAERSGSGAGQTVAGTRDARTRDE